LILFLDSFLSVADLATKTQTGALIFPDIALQISRSRADTRRFVDVR
jgi:hypothetical protein